MRVILFGYCLLSSRATHSEVQRAKGFSLRPTPDQCELDFACGNGFVILCHNLPSRGRRHSGATAHLDACGF
jgi:hypothetical protein